MATIPIYLQIIERGIFFDFNTSMRKSLLLLTLVCAFLNGQGQNWKVLYDSTEIYWNKDWGKCVALLEEALPLAAEDISPTSSNYMVLMNDLGLAYLESGNYPKAESIFVDLIGLKKDRLGVNSSEYAASVVNLAGIYQDLGEGDKAEKLYIEAIDNFKVSLGDQHPDYATAIQNLGQLYESEARFTQAESLYLSAIEIRKVAIGSFHPNYASSLFSLGRLYRKTGDYKKSKENFEQALEIYEKSYGKFHPTYANATGELGVLMQSMGQYTVAEKYLSETVKLKQNIYGKGHQQVAEAMNNLGSLNRVMGNFTKAESNYRQAEKIFEKTLGGNNPDYGTVLNNLGDFYVGVFEFEKARPYYNEASEIFKTNFGTGHPSYANTLNNLASLNRKTGNFKESEKFYKITLAIDENTLGKQHPAYATSLNNLAILYVATKRYSQAEPLYKESIRIKKATLGANHPAYAKSLNNLALLYMTQEDLGKAEPLFVEAIENQLNQIHTIFPALSEKEREAFYNTLRADLERFNTYAVFRALDNPNILEHMYNNQLTTKALLFNSSAKTRQSILQSNNAALIDDFGKWRNLRETLARLYQLPKMDLAQKETEMKRLEEEVEALEKNLSQRSALFAKDNNRQSYTWRDVQDNLEPNEAAIEIIRFRRYKIDQDGNSKVNPDVNIPEFLNYGFTDEVLYAALIVDQHTTSHPKLVLLEDGKDLETRDLSYYKNAIHYVVNDGNSYQKYWSKIAEQLPKSVKKIYVSPDGVYNKINLNTIKDPKTKNYLLDDGAVYTITNTKDLIENKQRSFRSKEAVLMGNPNYMWEGVTPAPQIASKEVRDYLDLLPGTGREVKNIGDLLNSKKWDAKIYQADNAQESILKATSNPRILHIATHGFFSSDIINSGNSNDFLNSGLLLAGSSNALYHKRNNLSLSDAEDGILTAYEAMNLNLDETELVVLSACETGLGTVKNGEGVYGLQRAFKVAGAQTIILSLWRVDDTTTQKLLGYFYQGWLQHQDKHRAFREAQIKLREEYLFPYYWGAFVMIGV